MARAKFSIGIDLGTTNCAMAFEALDGADSRTQVFAIPQWEKPGDAVGVRDAAVVPLSAGGARGGGARRRRVGAGAFRAEAGGGAAGARGAFGEIVALPSHGGSLRAVPAVAFGCARSVEQRISPVQASAILLQYLRAAWDAKFAGDGAEFRFDAQEITITVPASFDAVAQRLTLDAARQAGFPENVRLIEEPQAAFYRWLEQHGGPDDFWKALPRGRAGGAACRGHRHRRRHFGLQPV